MHGMLYATLSTHTSMTCNFSVSVVYILYYYYMTHSINKNHSINTNILFNNIQLPNSIDGQIVAFVHQPAFCQKGETKIKLTDL